mmetsp:Transcript_24183/g.38737  ORF Transcript_24183/g.38737 Transcript_24183/m.38737 type:complete len:443 (-) Transcript_24183:144-1472(-)
MTAKVEGYGQAENIGEEVKLMFELFDTDRSGMIDREELKNVFRTIDSNVWTEEKLDEMMKDFDKNGDGKLTMGEFWGWINGHGGRETSDHRPELLAKAVEVDKAKGVIQTAQLDEFRKRKTAQEAKDVSAAAIAAERAEGKRVSRKQWIQDKIDVGFTREVAIELYQKADQDFDGDIDHEELGWLAGDNLATVDQVKQLYQKGIGGAAGSISIKDCGDGGMGALVDAFARWDKDGDGTITSDELAAVLKHVNSKFTEVTVQKMMKEIDTDGDGFITLDEFIAWLSGENLRKKKMKKKAQEEQDAKINLHLHRKRAEEARDQKRTKEFEEFQHKSLAAWCATKKVEIPCNTLNPGPGAKLECLGCGGHHAWMCHECGFVSFFDTCVNGCSSSSYGWSCIAGKCPKKKCGCKKKPEIWQRGGYACVSRVLSKSVNKMLEGETSA